MKKKKRIITIAGLLLVAIVGATVSVAVAIEEATK